MEDFTDERDCCIKFIKWQFSAEQKEQKLVIETAAKTRLIAPKVKKFGDPKDAENRRQCHKAGNLIRSDLVWSG